MKKIDEIKKILTKHNVKFDKVQEYHFTEVVDENGDSIPNHGLDLSEYLGVKIILENGTEFLINPNGKINIEAGVFDLYGFEYPESINFDIRLLNKIISQLKA